MDRETKGGPRVTDARSRHAGRGARLAKRTIDVTGAAIGIALLSPLLIAIAIAAFITQGRPILFRQPRPGLDGRPFRIVKFRTMRPPRPDEMSLEADRQRLTRLGGFLRASTLDELPELWNVLKGEMSLVGPRPLLMEYLDRYTEEEARRHEVRPGMTGLAAVKGRHDLAFEERLRIDVWYVDHRSLSLDLRIIAATIRQVLRRDGVATVQRPEEISLPDRFRVQAVAGTAPGDTHGSPVR
jgi:lipopolysaccharide/colanic/teichoic acid biosynthesis glycosyltransferase